jgi:hypothetical protein
LFLVYGRMLKKYLIFELHSKLTVEGKSIKGLKYIFKDGVECRSDMLRSGYIVRR